MRRLLESVLGWLFIRRQPSPPMPCPSALLMAPAPGPDHPDPYGPVIADWHYHQFLLKRLHGRPDLQEIAHFHLHRCWVLQQPITHP